MIGNAKPLSDDGMRQLMRLLERHENSSMDY
jgi:hypothetical protein